MPTDLTFDIRLLSTIFGGAAAAPPASTLLNGLVSYWTLDEASGTRKDSIVASGNDLTDNNTVGSAPGMHNLAASFVAANNESLTNTDASLALVSGPFTWAAWINPSALSQNASILGKSNFSSQGWWFALEVSGNSYFEIGASSYAYTTTQMSSGAFNLVIGWYDKGGDNKVHVQIGNGVVANAATADASPTASGNAFSIGNNSGVNLPFDGLVDEVAIWSRVLTADERTELFNAGAGKFYPFA